MKIENTSNISKLAYKTTITGVYVLLVVTRHFFIFMECCRAINPFDLVELHTKQKAVPIIGNYISTHLSISIKCDTLFI